MVAAVRSAVRAALIDLTPGQLVLAACSGGADSLALASALAFVGPRMLLRTGGLTVDHNLQEGSGDRARAVVAALSGLGLDPTQSLSVHVGTRGGPEAAARAARYAALDLAADRMGADVILLGHTADDQAETVLLGLARGSGARSLAGMAPVAGRYRRPLLGLSRETVRSACHAGGLTPWDDPHNVDPAYARSRVRARALPVLEETLGPGIAAALARTARLLRADSDALDEIAAQAASAAARVDGLDCTCLRALPEAVCTRVLRAAAIAAGCPAGALAACHVDALGRLVVGRTGAGPVSLPGGVMAQRRCGTLVMWRSVQE